MAERWVRPPLLAREAPSPSAARWRFRVVSAVLLLLFAVLAAAMLIKLSGASSEDPGFGVGLQAPSGTVSTALVPRG